MSDIMKHSCFILRIFAILICQIFIISVRYTTNLAIDSTLHYTRKYPLLVVKLDTIRPSSATSSHMNWWPTEQITSKSMPAPYFLYVFFFSSHIFRFLWVSFSRLFVLVKWKWAPKSTPSYSFLFGATDGNTKAIYYGCGYIASLLHITHKHTHLMVSRAKVSSESRSK